MRVDGDETVVWSIGPDGEDDGGPLRDGEARDLDNDDVGLRMRVAAPAGAAP